MAKNWDAVYQDATDLAAPARVLTEHLHLLPAQGQALDLACGISGNGLELARNGLQVEVWDNSVVALQLQAECAASAGLSLSTQLRDCEQQPPAPSSFDVICVCHFLHRPMLASLAAALRTGGVLFYQTFTQHKRDSNGPSSADFLLQDNELVLQFSQLKLRYYQDDSRCGDRSRGERNLALFIAQKVD